MAILFLELDDEITSAVGRLRQVSDPVVALVLPAGSRIASSRINFRLLAREAEEHGTHLAIVSPEATARALAIAAGIPAYGAVREYQAATAGGAEPELPSGADGAAAVAMSPPAGVEAAPVVPPLEPAVDRSPRRLSLLGSRAGTVLVALLLLALIGAAGAAGVYFLLPEARVTVTPRIEAFGPLTFEVTADPDATANDPAAGVVAADWLETTVEARDTFRATGVKVTETKATGSVRFMWSGNQTDCPVPSGFTLNTKSGIAFATTKAVVVPRARLFEPGTASVGVGAVKAGTAGNVAADTITVIPSFPKGCSPHSYLTVTNPKATTGGTHTETKVVRQSDYDAAVGKLSVELRRSFDAWVDTQAGELGEDVVQRESAVLDAAEIEPAATDIVGKAMESFDLGGRAAGRVVAFDPTALVGVGAERFQASEVPAGYRLLEDSVTVQHRQVESDDPARPRYEITASGEGYRILDGEDIEAQILGKPEGDARTILARYGDATISLEPDWFGNIPSLDWRVSVEVGVPVSPS